MNSPFQDSWLNSDNLRLYLETPESELIRNVNPRAQQTVIIAKRGNQSPPPESKQIIVKSSGGLAIELPKLALNQLNHDKLLLPPSTSNEETINKKNRLDFTSSVRNFQLHSPLSQSYTSLKQHASAALEGTLPRPLESPLFIPLQQPQQLLSPQTISSYAKWNSPRSLSPSYLQYQRQQQQQTSQSQREAQEQANVTREAFMRRKFSNTMKNTFCLRNKIRSGGSYRDFGLTSEPSVNTLHKVQNQQQQQILQQQQNLDQQKSSLGGIQVKSVLPKREKLLPNSAPKKFVIPAKGTGPHKQMTSQYPPISKYEKILSLMSKDNNSRFVSSEDNSNMNSNDHANEVNSTNAYFSLFGVSSRAIFNKEQLLSSQRSAHHQLELPSKTLAASPDVYSNFNTLTIFNTNDQENHQRDTQTQFQLLSQSPTTPGIVLSTSQLTLEPPRPPFKPTHIIQNNSQSGKQILIYNNTNLSSLIAPHDDAAAKIHNGKNHNNNNFPNKTSFNSSNVTNNFSLNNEAFKTISLEKKNRIQGDIQLLQQQRLLQGYDFSKKMRNTISMHQLPNSYPKKEKTQRDKETQHGKNSSNSNQQFLEVVGKSKGIKAQSQLDDFMGIFQMNKNMMQSTLQQEAEQVKKLDRIVEEKDKRQQQIEQAREVEREIKRSMEREQQILKEKQLIKLGQIEQFKERQMKREAQRIGMLEKNKVKQMKKEEQDVAGKGQEKDTAEGDKRNEESNREVGRQILSQQGGLDVLEQQIQQQGVVGQGNEQVGIETGKRVSAPEGKEDERNSGSIIEMQSSDKGRMKFSRVDSNGNIIASNNTGGDELDKMQQSSQREIQQEQQQQQKPTSERLVQVQQSQQSVSESEIPLWAMQEPDKLEKLAEANEKLAGTGGDDKNNGIKEQTAEEDADEEQINVLTDIHKVIQTLHNDEEMEMTNKRNLKTNGSKLLEEKGIVSYVQRASMEGDAEKIIVVKEDGIKKDDNGYDGVAAVGSSRVILVQKHDEVQGEQHQQQTSITVINPPPLPPIAQAESVLISQNDQNIQDKLINSSRNISSESLKAQEHTAAGIISINILPMESGGEMKEHADVTGQVESLPQPIILIIPAEETKQKFVDANRVIEGKNDGVMSKQGQYKDKEKVTVVVSQKQGKEGELVEGDKVKKMGDSQVKEIAGGDKMKESNPKIQKEDQNNGKQMAQSEQPQLQQQSSQKFQQQQQQNPQQPPTPSSSPSSSLVLSQQPSQPIQRISISVSQAQDTEPSSSIGQQEAEQKQEDDNNEEGGFVMKKVIDFDSLKVLRDKTINRLSVQTSQQKKQSFASNNPGSAQLPSKAQSNAKQLTIQTQQQQSSSRSIVNSPNKGKISSNNANSTASNNGGINQNSNNNSYVQNNTNNNNSSAGNNTNNIAKTPMKQQQQQPVKKTIISPTAAAAASAAAQSGSGTTTTNKFAKKNNKSKPKRKEEEQPVVVVEEISEEQKRQEKQREQDLIIAQKLEEVRDKVKQGVKSVIKDQIAKKLQAMKLNAKKQELDGGDVGGEVGQNGQTSSNNGSGQTIPSVAEYHSAVMELYSACIDDLRETASSSNTGSANSLSNNNLNNNQENTKPDGHDFELRGMRHFDAGMSASIGKALETELRKTEMNEAEVERFRYIYEINTKVHVLYSGMVKMLGGADKVRKLITAVLRRVSSHLPMLPIGFEWSYEVIHRRIIPGICALLCDDQQLFLRNLRQFSKTQEFTFIDFYFAKRETFSLLTGNKIKKIFPELSQELSLGVIQKIESVRRYMFPVKVLADGEIRDTIMKGLMSCEQFVELFMPNKLTNKFLSNLLAQIFDYFYSDVESDSAPKPPKIRAICQPLLAQTLSRKLLDYIEAFTLRALQNDRFTLNLILRDLHYKFTKVRLRLGFKQGIFGHFDTFEDIDGLIEQLELEVKAAIHYGAADFFPESQRAKLTDMKFLKYYLKFLLAEHDIFSVFDFAVAMPYDGVLHSHFLFWMNCLRAVILTKYDFQPAQAHVFIRFLEACCPAS